MDEAFRLEALRSSDLPTDFGPFRLVRILGQGSMGRVFEATRGVDRVALKVIRPADGPDFETFSRVLDREARLGELLDHPGIVPTLDHGEHAGVPWLAFELVDGVDLASILDHWGALPPRVALTIAAQVARALDHAHHLQTGGRPTPVVHRDVKPANVLLARGGHARLVDFGIAKAAMLTGLTTGAGQTRGTPRYISPEQVRGLPVDGRSDLFGLGVLLFEMLTGRQLFSDDTMIEVMASVVAVERTLAQPGLFDSLEEAAPGASGLIRRCLRADPAHRFTRGDDLVDALAPLLQDAGGPDLEAFVLGVLDGPDDDVDTERAEWEAFEEHVGLRGTALDADEILRSVTGDHPAVPRPATPNRATPRPLPELAEAVPTPPTLDSVRSQPRADVTPPSLESMRPPPGPPLRFDKTDVSRGVLPRYADTEPSAVGRLDSIPSLSPASPNPFAELRSSPPPAQEDSPLWWGLVAVAAAVAVAVLWFALGR